MGCYIWYSEEEPGRGCSPYKPLLAVQNVTAQPFTAIAPITVLLYNGPLFCSYYVSIKALICLQGTFALCFITSLMQKTLALTNAGDDKTGTQANPKMSGFRSKFEKFGGSPATGFVKPGTPAPFRRNSAAADVTAAAATADKSSSSSDAAISVGKDLLGDLQKQLADAEKTRVKDRQELIDKLAAQKKEFDAELQEMKKKNKQVISHFLYQSRCQRIFHACFLKLFKFTDQLQ